jgi:hypothetical protein
MSDELSYMDIPHIYIRNGVSIIDGEEFYDITDWGGSFIEQVRAALLKIGQRERGKKLLEGIIQLTGQAGRGITIEPAEGFDGQNGPGWAEDAHLLRWNPIAQPATSEDEDQLNGIPTFIILGHELVHALHSLQGSTKYTGKSSDDKAIEECRTIGLGPWKNDALTENGLRSEWGLEARTTFSGAAVDRLLKGTKYAGL